MQQFIFETRREEFDFYGTYERARCHPWVGSIDQAGKELSLIYIKPRGMKATILISPYGKVEVTCNTEEELRKIKGLLEDILVSKRGERLTLKLTYELNAVRYIGCPPNEEESALWEEFISRLAARSFLRRKRIGRIVAPIERRWLLRARDRVVHRRIQILKRINRVLERLEGRLRLL